MPLNTRDGRGRGADRSRRADVVRAVRLGAALEVVALDRALEALALGRAGDLDLLAGRERLDGDRLADEQLAGLVAELGQVAVGRGVGLLQVAELGLGQRLLLAGAEGELDGLVAVALDACGSRSPDTARPRARSRARRVPSSRNRWVIPSFLARIAAIGARRRGGSRYPRRPGDGRVAGASRPSSGSAGGCRSVACACGSRSARASPCP